MDFSGPRARSLARLSAYTLLLTFLITLVGATLPLPLHDPQRAFAVLAELIGNSTVPVVAVVLLYFGLTGTTLPAFLEWRLLRLLRPLLRLAALLYLLTALAVVGTALAVERSGISQLEAELQTSLVGLQRLRQAVAAASDGSSLRQLMANQPGMLEALRQEQPSAADDSPLAAQRTRAAELLDRAEANLRQQSTRRRADASGNLTRQALRLGLSALIYGLFHLAASLLWPRSLIDTRDRILEARADRLAVEAAEASSEGSFP
ncbi:HpsJ family protein [Synechococcus sp. CS-1328]|nr:HpsJ family protein [Synechococcus sp. CS-1328]